MSKVNDDIKHLVLKDGTVLVPRNCTAPAGAIKACRKCYANGNMQLCRKLCCGDPQNRIWVKQKPAVQDMTIKKGKTLQQQSGKYLLIMEGDIEPLIKGPFKTDKARLASARKWRLEHGKEDGLYPMAVHGFVSIDTFRGGDFPDEE